MSYYLSLTPWLVAAQACGVGLVWLTDLWSWRSRYGDGRFVGVSWSVAVILGLVFIGFAGIQPVAIGTLLTVLTFCAVALIQAKQFNERWVVAFWGALYQSWCFVFSFGASAVVFGYYSVEVVAVSASKRTISLGPPFSLFALSAIVTQFLFTLFRPTMDGVGRQIRSVIDERVPLRWRRCIRMVREE